MKEIRTILNRTGLISESEIIDIQSLAGDASSKQFYRVLLRNKDFRSLILLKLVAASGPLHTGQTMTQDLAFREIGDYLRVNNLPVPKLYWFDGELGYGLEEDLGDNLLANYLNPNFIDSVKLQYFQRATTLIPLIQNLPNDGQTIIYKRFFAEENYRQESNRFLEFYAEPGTLTNSEQDLIREMISQLARSIPTHPQVPIFRDLMAWNIMIDAEDQLRLVDFQDLIIGSYSYDLLSLLHDRDTDFALGEEILTQLFKNYLKVNNLPEVFIKHYLECLLQRHLRLAGQFINLTNRTGRNCYASWVPGSMYRIGRALATFKDWPEVFSQCLPIFLKLSPDFENGYAKPYNF